MLYVAFEAHDNSIQSRHVRTVNEDKTLNSIVYDRLIIIINSLDHLLTDGLLFLMEGIFSAHSMDEFPD